MSTFNSTNASHATAGFSETHSLVSKMAQKYGVDPQELPVILKATAFKQLDGHQISNEQLYALLVVADMYELNPFVREIKAYQDSHGGIIPVVGIDGWNRIANNHPQFDGVEFVYSDSFVELEGSDVPCHAWIEVLVHRKDRAHPTRIKEYIDECYRVLKDSVSGEVIKTPWQTHPKRNLRHKTLVQGYRVALSLVGIFDEDEAQRILAAQREDIRRPAAIVPLTRSIKPVKAIESDQPSKETVVVPSVASASSDNALDKAKLDEFVSKLVARAKANGQWKAAHSLCKERLSGEQYTYASEVLAKHEKLSTAVSTPVEPASVSPEKVPEEETPAEQQNGTGAFDLLATSSNVDF